MLILPMQYKHFWGEGGWGVQNFGKHAYIILEHSLTVYFLLVGDHPRDDREPSMAVPVVTYYKFCELSISAKTYHYSTLSSGG